jgi:hypothetical protein
MAALEVNRNFYSCRAKAGKFSLPAKKNCKQKITLYRRHTLVRATKGSYEPQHNNKNATPSIMCSYGTVYDNSDIFNIKHRQLNYSSSDFYALSGLSTNEAKSILKLTF